MSKPILYSFRRCPFAIRARIALYTANIQVELREVVLRQKPQAMLAISPKATVPVLQLPNGQVIDESLDIMYWALKQNDPLGLINLDPHQQQVGEPILKIIPKLNKAIREYKFIDKYPEINEIESGEKLLVFLNGFEGLLEQQAIVGAQHKIYDYALFPFVRQIVSHNRKLLEENDLYKLLNWHDQIICSDPFISVMKKYKMWEEGVNGVCFPEKN
ncbi:glutathione S-transferase N-terminal domain-containing protein [Francisellaceae bacterium]|nr:glutathione S-transferase N-terminal domain-containing protein [Francisellaceae bacterium]